MKYLRFLIFCSISLLLLSCSKDDGSDINSENSENNINKNTEEGDFRGLMRDFVIKIAKTARVSNPNFIVIPQNGIELITLDGEPNGEIAKDYVSVVSGHGQEDLFYGYDDDNEKTPKEASNYLLDFLKVANKNGNKILVTDYCSTHSKMDNSYKLNNEQNFISFSAPNRNLDIIPDYPNTCYNENSSDITKLSQANNFLYILDNSTYNSTNNFINSVSSTNYDVIIMDCFTSEDREFTKDEITKLKKKKNGAKRLVISYLSIGEAEIYRYYWQKNWKVGNPSFICDENPDWEGNYKVEYWNEDWQNIILAYLSKIQDAGFDGVYLDIIDTFEYFESLKK